jgi:hypothetical protein
MITYSVNCYIFKSKYPKLFLEILPVPVGEEHFIIDEYYLPFFTICIFSVETL